jgi:hypothetical protein
VRSIVRRFHVNPSRKILPSNESQNFAQPPIGYQRLPQFPRQLLCHPPPADEFSPAQETRDPSSKTGAAEIKYSLLQGGGESPHLRAKPHAKVKTVQNCSHSESLRIYPHADVNAALDQPTSNPPKQHKNDNDDQDDADNADATVSVAVTVAAEAAAEAAKQENDEDDKENKSQRHDSLSLSIN